MSVYAAITDASQTIGWGHAARQIALASRGRDRGFHPILISGSPVTRNLCQDAGIPFVMLEDPAEMLKYLHDHRIRRLIIDVHEKNFPTFRTLCRGVEQLMLVVSEVGHTFKPFGHHMVRIGSDMQEWNSRVVAQSEYGLTQLHAGRAWLLFRDEFQNTSRTVAREFGAILIAHGGSDPHGLTARSLRALERTTWIWTVYVLVTDSCIDIETVERLAADSKHKWQVIKNTSEVAAWMRRSTVALINGGNVRYELCVAQTPFVAISFQPQQYACTERIAALGAGINLGVMNEVGDEAIAHAVEELLMNDARRHSMQEVMGTLFDFGGCDRMLDLIEG